MYQPAPFQESDRQTLFDFIDSYGFATLVSFANDGPMVSHLPLLLEREATGQARLLGHLARANPHWEYLRGQTPALAIFHGPHSYISPTWYAERPAAPTWNYAVVHTYGVPKLADSDLTENIIRRLFVKYEQARPNPLQERLPREFVRQKLRAIVGFELPIDRLEGKFKLSQNKSRLDRAGVLDGLLSDGDAHGVELADFARAYFDAKDSRRD